MDNPGPPRIGGSARHSSSSLSVVRASKIPHQEFICLKPEQRRSLPHVNDMWIKYEGHQNLILAN